MQQELLKKGIKTEMAALSHASWASQTSNISNRSDFPVLQDVKSKNVWDKMSTPGKEYIWVFDKNGVVVSFFKPWELSLGDGNNYTTLRKLLEKLSL